MKKVSPSRGISRGQIGKVEEMLGHGILKSTVFQGTATAEIDRFIKKVFPELRDGFVKQMEMRFQDFSGVFSIPVNYDEPEAIAKAIKENKFDEKYVGLTPAEIPLVGTGQVVREVHEVHFGRVMYNRDLLSAFKQLGGKLGFKGELKLADSLTALRFSCANPDRQRKYTLATLFNNKNGQLWYLYLNESSGGRYIFVDQSDPNGYWDEGTRFLAVCEFPSVD